MNLIEYNDMLYFHPGYYIREVMIQNFADILGWDYDFLESLIDGKIDVDDELAEILAHKFGTSKNVWLNLQENFDKVKEIMKNVGEENSN